MRAVHVIAAVGIATVLVAALVIVALIASAETGSSFEVRGGILISANEEFTRENGVRGGHGTPADPFIIEKWRIVQEGYHGVFLHDTSAHVVIRDVIIECPIGQGVHLWRVENVRIERLRASECGPAIAVDDSHFVVVRGNTLLRGNAISVDRSTWIRIEENRISYGDGLTLEGSGLIVTRSANFTIIGNDVRSSEGVWLRWVADGEIRSNVVAASNEALALHDAVNVTVEGNRLSLPSLQASQRVFRMSGSSNIHVSGNDMSSAYGKGLRLESSVNVTIFGNSFWSSGITLRGTVPDHFASHTITDNVVNGKPVLYVRHCVDFAADGLSLGQLIVADCTGVRVAGMEFANTDDAVQVAWTKNLSVAGVRVVGGHEYGVFLGFVENAVVTGNAISESEGGMLLVSTTNVWIKHNEISRLWWHDAGIEDHGSANISVIENRLTDTRYALELWDSVNAEVLGNEIAYAGMGLVLSTVETVRVRGNGFAGNEYGIVLDGRGENLTSHAVTVSGNEFVKNRVQAVERSRVGQAWDGAYPQGGNFWFDYAGRDRCRGAQQDDCTGPDELGDSPYVIDMENQDRYPLMMTPVRFNYPPVARVAVSPYHAPNSTMFAVNASASSDIESPLSSLEARWDWEGDGVWDTAWSVEKIAHHRYDTAGWHTLQLAVRDPGAREATAKAWVYVDPVLGEQPSSTREAPTPWIPLTVIGLLLVGAPVLVRLGRGAFRVRRRPPPKAL